MLNYHFFKTQVDDVGWADFNYNTKVREEIVPVMKLLPDFGGYVGKPDFWA